MRRLGLVGLLVALGWAIQAGWSYWRGTPPAGAPVASQPAPRTELRTVGGPEPLLQSLQLPAGFTMTIVARELDGARALALDPNGTLLVSLSELGKVVALPDKDQDGIADEVVTVVAGLNKPHGLAFRPGENGQLYIAAREEVVAFTYDSQHLAVGQERRVAALPPGEQHVLRSLLFMPPPDGRLLVTVSASGEATEEKDWRYGKVLALPPDGGEAKTFAAGLHQSLFMTAEPGSGRILATEMSVDRPGEAPPDEVNILKEGRDYGWPWCAGKQGHDGQADPQGLKKDFCGQTEPSVIELPGRSAPLGLAFIPTTDSWPAEYQGSLLVALHGSWNHNPAAGYKVVRFKPDGNGGFGPPLDFLTGWLPPDGQARGRPVAILATPGGKLYISDDTAGVVYQVRYQRPATATDPQ